MSTRMEHGGDYGMGITQEYPWQVRITVNGVDFTGPGCDAKQEAEAIAGLARKADGVDSAEVERT